MRKLRRLFEKVQPDVGVEGQLRVRRRAGVADHVDAVAGSAQRHGVELHARTAADVAQDHHTSSLRLFVLLLTLRHGCVSINQ